MAPKIADGSGLPGINTLDAPTEKGNVSELPMPYAKNIFGTEKHTSSGRQFQNVPFVARGGIGHVVLQMHDALRPPGRTR